MYLAAEKRVSRFAIRVRGGGDGRGREGIGDVEECCCANGLAGKIVCLSWVCPLVVG